MEALEQMYEKIIQRIDMNHELSDDEIRELIHNVIKEESKQRYISLKEETYLGKELFNAFRKLDLLQELIEDEDITEIMINGTQSIFYEKAGKIYQSDRSFVSVNRLEDIIQQIVAKTNRYVNEANPIVDARLEDGSRVNIVLRPIALNGPIMTIRKFPKEKVTMDQLIQWGSISKECAVFLKKLVRSRYNIFVCEAQVQGKLLF